MGKTSTAKAARITVPITVKIASGILGLFAVILILRGIVVPFLPTDNSAENTQSFMSGLLQVVLGASIMFCAVRFYHGGRKARTWALLISLCAASVGVSNLSIYFGLPPELQAVTVPFLVMNIVEILLSGTAFALLFVPATREYILKVTEEEERELARHTRR